MIADVEKLNKKRDQNRGLFSDQKSTTPVAGSRAQRHGKEEKEERKWRNNLLRPPVTSSVSNHDGNKTSIRGSDRKIREKERGRGPMIGF